MKDCQFDQDLLLALVRGELGDDSSARVRAHIGDCGECQERFERMKWAEDVFNRSTGSTRDQGSSEALAERALRKYYKENPRPLVRHVVEEYLREHEPDAVEEFSIAFDVLFDQMLELDESCVEQGELVLEGVGFSGGGGATSSVVDACRIALVMARAEDRSHVARELAARTSSGELVTRIRELLDAATGGGKGVG